ncbi:Pentatricopeptide repeat-containing protein [Sesamum angolense]|uniref:Pentatricopeptide repeat-containing protein n=1 Tax=Sesamum angolense TaxID=2727404 RepID=A0AAE2BMF3_9LAMI|nr:Pentatricopeptide repeat-containing protein [Sesamum angolense]
MESLILPCKTLIPSKIPEKPAKFNSLSANNPPKLTHDAYLKRLCKLGRLSDAISSLDSCGSTVRHSTLSHLIESCIHSNSLDLCYKLHASVKKLIKEPDPFIETKLVGMYAKCGSLDDAFVVFEGMRERNLYAWSAIIGACSREKRLVGTLGMWRLEIDTRIVIKSGKTSELRVNNSILAVYAKCGWLSSARRFFEGMKVNDRVSWNAIITGYCQAGKINEAQRLFELMCEEGPQPDAITWNVLISSCNQLGKCDVAMKLMNEMESSGVKPVFTWSSMILGFAQNNRRLEALKLFREMLLAGVEPNSVTLMSAISASSSMKDIRKGKEVHLIAIKMGCGQDVLVGNSLVDMYSKCGKLEAARKVFDMIPQKDVYTWNSLIGGYCQAGYCGIAHDLFKQMQESDVLPNVITWNVMITGYIQNGDEDQAMDLFHRMEKNGGVKRDTASWNALIAGYLHHGEKNKALGIFRQMQSFGVKPNAVTILSILPACANLVAFKKLKEIHCCVLRSNLESELSVANSLIDTYAKSGNLKYSKAIFDGLPSLDIDYRPNRSTFVSIITAYGLAKMVDKGREGILMKFDFISDMAVEPDVPVWFAFLTACCRHGNVKLAIHAGEKLLELEPEMPSFGGWFHNFMMYGDFQRFFKDKEAWNKKRSYRISRVELD